ncbi:MAG: lipoyl(octanoyl) transferase LipB [Bacteroidia bacterium]
MMQPVLYKDLGRIDYQEAWDMQETLLRENVELKLRAGNTASPHNIPTKHYLLLCEHPPVYTLGKSGKAENLLIDAQTMQEKGISFYKINRGGDITYHGPGQITGYPIFDLEKFRTDIGWYLRSMEDVMIGVLADFGLEGGRIAGATGVWLGVNSENPRKICAMGVRCSRWVTMHGFALNVNTDLRYFEHIIPCGIDDKGVTSLEKECGEIISVDKVKASLQNHFTQVFGCQFMV